MTKDQSSPNDRVPMASDQGARSPFGRSSFRDSGEERSRILSHVPHDGLRAPQAQAGALGRIQAWALALAPLALASRRLSHRSLLLLFLFAASPACISETPAGTVFGSDPPGATLYVDGKESGFVTPCSLHLSEGDDHKVRLELPGYLPAEFELEKALRVDLIGWGEGTTLSTGFTSPTYLPFFGLFAPIRTNRGLAPGRIFVRLQALDSRP